MLLDTTYDIATPEGVELQLPLAGIGARTLAWLVDAGIKAFVTIALGLVLGSFGDLGTGLILLGLFATLWLYNVLFEVLNHGRTPGKAVLGLRVMNANGTPVGWTASVIRNLVRFVDTLPGTYLFGCLAVMLTRRFQRLGDLAAGTVVVYSRRQDAGHDPRRPEPAPVKVPLSLDEQQAIVDFGQRAPLLNAERAEELAALLEPVLGDVDAARLRAHASWLAGRRTP